MKNVIMVVLSLAIIAVAGYWIVTYGSGKFWNVPVREQMADKVELKGRTLSACGADLVSRDVAVRRHAAEELMTVPPKDGQYIVGMLAKGVTDEDNLTRARAGIVLGRVLAIGIPAPQEAIVSTPTLVQLQDLLKDSDPAIRRTGAEALASFGRRVQAAAPALEEAAKNEQDEEVRKAAASALEKIQPKSSRTSVEKAKSEPARAAAKKG